jgi:hypothetical protein
MKYLLVFSLLFVSCSVGQSVNVEPQYKKYVTLFEQESARVGHPVVIKGLTIESRFTLGGFTLAQCRMFGFPNPSILVSLYWWDRTNEVEHEMVLLHEISHCILRRYHRNDLYPDGRPKSIMNEEMFDGNTYLNNRDEYIRELFEENT